MFINQALPNHSNVINVMSVSPPNAPKNFTWQKIPVAKKNEKNVGDATSHSSPTIGSATSKPVALVAHAATLWPRLIRLG